MESQLNPAPPSSAEGGGAPSTPRLGPEAAPVLTLRGVDVNRADAATLAARLDGVGPALAAALVNNREVFGPFLTLHDLARVPGVGPSAFTRITAQPWREDAVAKREKVLAIVGPTEAGDVSLREVALRFAATEGFEGCLVADRDGDVLATSWNQDLHEVVGAMAPLLLERLTPFIQSMGAGPVDCVSLFLGERAFTLIPFETLVFVAVHQTNKFSRRQLRMAQQVTALLGQLLFRRPR